ncbi:quinone oxidoreductase family protein [Humibacter ginsenosidimutans]|uniref:Zinc-binding alcohol dehydrogenase family protein n=1 Tax=Humibacter ginsenosidimutans TaxID=2599293 RepID=A0A5B8M4W1_9MICO|nr:zinc-binding alcohol dehydrogenase family protein [Humibacter ginsenosidimutans]QDZ15049.1 zinc-binding alcohol dehydrogenase family protein [Humibacter ginsenosidimutans]
MKAAVIDAAGTAPRHGDFAEPVVEEGRELVSLVATGIHPIVRGLASGEHYGSQAAWPLIPGVDAVARTADGTLLYTGYVTAPYGTIAERMAVPAGLRLPLPAGADPVQVAAAMNPGLSSWMPLVTRKNELGSLGTVLVLGVTGTAGLLAVQNALALGADRVIGAGRNAERLRAAGERGAQTVALTGDRAADSAALRTALGDGNPSLVLDFVWGEPAEAAFDALARKGLAEDEGDTSYVEIGALAGEQASLPASLLRSTRIRVQGSGAGSASLADLMGQLPVYLDLIATGAVTVPVRQYPLSRVADAWADSDRAGVRSVVVPD